MTHCASSDFKNINIFKLSEELGLVITSIIRSERCERYLYVYDGSNVGRFGVNEFIFWLFPCLFYNGEYIYDDLQNKNWKFYIGVYFCCIWIKKRYKYESNCRFSGIFLS